MTAGADKLRRHKEFLDGAASWSRVERIIASVEAAARGTDNRFVITNLAGGTAHTLYKDLQLLPWPSGELQPVLEDPPGRRLHLMPSRHSQPVVPEAAHLRLLAYVVAAPPDVGAVVLVPIPG